MKRGKLILVSLGILLGSLFSANAQTADDLLAKAQSHLAEGKNILIITGKLIDAMTNNPITNAKINFDSFGDEVAFAAVDKTGNYTIALNKDATGKLMRILFKVKGYNQYNLKTIKNNAQRLALDLKLMPEGSGSRSNADAKYIIDSDQSGKLTISF